VKSVTKSKRIPVESIRIGLASPEQIKQWANRTLPNGKIVGRITNSQTVNYKTLRPVKGGFFCERIFGPIKDFECACGRKKNKKTQKFCPECDVEYTSSRIRRHRLGYIQLISPVTHIWYLKGRVSYISILLGLRRKRVEAVTYCTEKLELSEIKKYKFSFTPTVKGSFKKLPTYSFYYSETGVKTPLLRTTKTPFETKNGLSGSVFEQFLNLIDNLKSNKIGIDRISQTFSQQCILPISQEFPWQSEKDRNYFLGYMTCLPKDGDIPIPTYSNLVENVEIDISDFNLTGIETVRKVLANTGALAINKRLKELDLVVLDKILRVELTELKEDIIELENQGFLILPDFRRLQRLLAQRSKTIRRLKLVRDFLRTKARPEWMILSTIPVLPPDLRPIIQLDGDQVAVSDLNKLYQKIFFRNKRFHRTNIESAPYAQRLLQEAVDALIENGKGGSDPIRASNDRPLKSLSDILKGKKGRFRQNLLGKRVDYSGRSVIVVGPTLKLHECGLPKEMAVELFQPFLIRQLMAKKIVPTIVTAKNLIHNQDPILWEVLQQIMQSHPILLNRAPTLHRLGIQAFQPKLVNGRAILLHPLVCPAFNADFDGDQMAVHVPLSFEARAESWKLMWSRNNLLSPATGQPILVPSQDMVLGCYYLTTFNSKPQLTSLVASNGKQNINDIKAESKNNFVLQKKSKKRGCHYFSDFNDILKAYYQNKIDLHASVWVRKNGSLETEKTLESPLEIRVNSFGQYNQIFSTYQYDYDMNGQKVKQYVRTTPGRVLLNQIIFT
jgi:DNA-directed RNA polymerase subunit beta'